jgi:hypothetical protein
MIGRLLAWRMPVFGQQMPPLRQPKGGENSEVKKHLRPQRRGSSRRLSGEDRLGGRW